MSQYPPPPLFQKPSQQVEAKPIQFKGETFDEKRDGQRLRTQLERVRDFMADRRWHTLKEIGTACEAPEASVSARLRDLKAEHRFVGKGIWEYRVLSGGEQ